MVQNNTPLEAGCCYCAERPSALRASCSNEVEDSSLSVQIPDLMTESNPAVAGEPGIFPYMAVGVRFELTVPFQTQQFSRLPP